MAGTLQIQDLRVQVEGTPILQGIDLAIGPGEIHALMGPNGSGKSTLANALMGHPKYEVTGGRVLLDGEDVLALDTAERAVRGLFLAFQYPVEIPGLSVRQFLKRALELRPAAGRVRNFTAFVRELGENLDFLGIDRAFAERSLNEGFSGGEKKRMEILQLLMLKPRFAVLDETDSGLDIDALKVVARGVAKLRGPDFGALIITHYQRILNHLRPDFVHIMYRGQIAISGGNELVADLEEKGYAWVRQACGIPDEAPAGGADAPPPRLAPSRAER